MATAPSLLNLPSPIRAQILRHTGLLRCTCIFISEGRECRCRDGTPEVCYNQYGTQENTPKPFTPGLLSTCKQLHREAGEILYGENVFIIYCDIYSNEQHFFNLSPKTLGMLRRVEFIVARRRLPGDDDLEYDVGVWSEEDFMKDCEQLNRICATLSGAIRPNQMELSFNLTGNLAKATELLKPIEKLPPVASLRLKVSDNFHPNMQYLEDGSLLRGDATEELVEIQRRLRSIVEKHRSPIPAGPTFHPFSRLPTELQLIIVSYATSIEPAYEGTGFEVPGVTLSPRHCQFFDCTDRPCQPCCGKCGKNDGALSCYCNSIESVSPTCICAPMRNGLLGTSRHVRELALEGIFSNNLFRVGGSPKSILEHMRNVPRNFLAQIKHVNIELNETMCLNEDMRKGLYPQKCQDLADLLAMLRAPAAPKMTTIKFYYMPLVYRLDWNLHVKVLVGIQQFLDNCAGPGREIHLLLPEGPLYKLRFYPARELLLRPGFKNR